MFRLMLKNNQPTRLMLAKRAIAEPPNLTLHSSCVKTSKNKIACTFSTKVHVTHFNMSLYTKRLQTAFDGFSYLVNQPGDHGDWIWLAGCS